MEPVIKYDRCQNLCYGVSYLNQSIYFKIYRPNVKECYLNLYHKKDKSKNLRILMQPMSGSKKTFLASLEDFPCQEYEYCFEADGEEFIEDNAKVIYGRETFGKREEGKKLRAGFLVPLEGFEEDEVLQNPYHELIIYKLHVRGFSIDKSLKSEHPGTFLGVLDQIEHMKSLGVNAILLMPITEFDECNESKRYKPKQDFLNYWGYDVQSYMYAPKQAYSYDHLNPDRELKYVVQHLHKHGIEVLLEMNFPVNFNPIEIVDCLNYWHQEYHIDGFKTNIADHYRSIIAASPLLQEVKLMDVWWNLKEIMFYTDGRVPSFLAEYNDGFKVDARKFLKGDEAQVNSYMSRTKYQPEQMAVVNYITNHDGFTLHDLYTYDIKHNEDNGENNRDGNEYNYSWNCGVEGETKNRKVNALRKKMVENALLTMFLSQGTPLLLAGDEFGNTQFGNNNAYCQDNEISWIDWSLLGKNRKMLEFTKQLIQLRKQHPILHQPKEMRAMDYIYCGMPDISFHGTKAWQPDLGYYSRELGVLLCGKYVAINRVEFDQSFYIIYNMHWEVHEFGLPHLREGSKWAYLLSTDSKVQKQAEAKTKVLLDQRKINIPPRTICVIVETKESVTASLS